MLAQFHHAGSIVHCVCSLALLACATTATAESRDAIEFDRKQVFAPKNRALDLQPGAVAHLDAREGEGLAWISGARFREGRVSIEVKGINETGRSFVGIAFHGEEDRNRFEVAYLRPFNFQAEAPERRSHALQYMSMPDHPWNVLREQFPGKYEAALTPSPSPDAWVRLTLEVKDNVLRVFIEDAATPALTTSLLGSHQGDALALWVGNNSEGWFRNLRIEDAQRLSGENNQ